MRARQASQAGFSLVELMVAMVITLIITGAIYGLMASSQSSFKRDPEISDRQQNIRVAMDLIQRDIATAGMGMTAFMTAFTDLDVTTNAPLDGAGPMGPDGINSDYLEIYGNSGECPGTDVCTIAGNNLYFANLPNCYLPPMLPGPVLLTPGFSGESYSIGWAFNPNTLGTPACPGGKVNFPPGQGPPAWNDPPGSYAGTPSQMSVIDIIRYEIHYRSAGADLLMNTADDVISPVFVAGGIPELWRSTMAGMDANMVYAPPPGPGWSVVATGIDDLQIQYRNQNGGPDGLLNTADDWLDRPGLVDPDLPDPGTGATPVIPSNFGSIVQQVRVTLSARTIATNIAGVTQGVAGPAAIRGRLVSVTTPRAALFALAGPDSQWTHDPGTLQWR
jgi:prepilin-type N-terminal cleavage/methylation domain-containing protein